MIQKHNITNYIASYIANCNTIHSYTHIANYNTHIQYNTHNYTYVYTHII